MRSTAARQPAVQNHDLDLADEVAKYYDDPLGFVLFAYPWGEKGSLRDHVGPDRWQAAFLRDLGTMVKQRRFNGIDPVAPIRMGVSSGHGIGKSVMVAWLVGWLMSTRANCKGTITANTFVQLSTRTWATIRSWTTMSITGHWFELGSDKMSSRHRPSDWFCSAQTCREENSEAFAGQHNAGSTSFYIFDEASAIPDKIWEVAEGGLTDGEPMIFAFGNPTRRDGKFFRLMFGADRGQWDSRTVDSRDAKFTNKTVINDWIKEKGEDSDFVRVRVRGLAPNAGDLQFIDSQRVYDAQRRSPVKLPDDPLIVGVDLARGGADSNVIAFRRGNDARTIPAIRIPGEESRDSMRVVSKLAEVLSTPFGGRKPDICFLDATGLGGPICDRMRQLGFKNVVEVQFGSHSPDRHYANMRSYMWARLKEWLTVGAISADPQLETDLTGPGFGHDKQDRLLLESKESMKTRQLSSTDDGDALALTFAHPVPQQKAKMPLSSWQPAAIESGRGWMA